jgi:hypothetical protein
MYSEKMNNLIQIALSDGILTEKERQILLKNAQAEGIDLDEFEMVLDAKLHEISKNKTDNSALKSNKLGDVKKCPACGAVINSFQTVCNECGYEFRNIDANSTVATLSAKLEAVVTEYDKWLSEKKNLAGKLSSLTTDRETEISNRQSAIIKLFPIPNTREDILELLHFIYPKIEDDTDLNKDAWNNKFIELINRAKIAYSNDANMLSEISKLEKSKKSKISKVVKKIIPIAFAVLLIVGVLVFGYLSKNSEGYIQEKNRLESILENINAAIKDHNLDEAEILSNQLIWEYNDTWNSYSEEKKSWREKRKGIINIIRESKGLEPLKEEEKGLLDAFKDKLIDELK